VPEPSQGDTLTVRVDARSPIFAIGWATGYSTWVLPVNMSLGQARPNAAEWSSRCFRVIWICCAGVAELADAQDL